MHIYVCIHMHGYTTSYIKKNEWLTQFLSLQFRLQVMSVEGHPIESCRCPTCFAVRQVHHLLVGELRSPALVETGVGRLRSLYFELRGASEAGQAVAAAGNLLHLGIGEFPGPPGPPPPGLVFPTLGEVPPRVPRGEAPAAVKESEAARGIKG